MPTTAPNAPVFGEHRYSPPPNVERQNLGYSAQQSLVACHLGKEGISTHLSLREPEESLLLGSGSLYYHRTERFSVYSVENHLGSSLFRSKALWFKEAVKDLNELDDEIKEDGLPPISVTIKGEARRILDALAYEKGVPTAAVFPSDEGEIVIQFDSPKSSVLIELCNDGRGAACFSLIDGKKRRARYDDSRDLPDEFVKAQLRELAEAVR